MAEYAPLPEDLQLPKDVGEKVYKQSCGSCHSANGQGGYLMSGIEIPPLSKSNGFIEEVEEDFELEEGGDINATDLAYSVIREHTREPPGLMAVAVGTDGWSYEVISEEQADAVARWLLEDAPEAPQPGPFEEPEAHEESLDELKEEFPMPPEDERHTMSEGEVLFERSCANCHESTVKFAGPPGVETPGEEAPPLAPHERQEVGLDAQTYYHFREHIRAPPKLMAHFVHDTLTNETGYSEEVFTVAEADAIARFIAADEGEAESVDPDTGLPPEYATEGPTASPTEAPSPGFTALLGVLGILSAALLMRRR